MNNTSESFANPQPENNYQTVFDLLGIGNDLTESKDSSSPNQNEIAHSLGERVTELIQTDLNTINHDLGNYRTTEPEAFDYEATKFGEAILQREIDTVDNNANLVLYNRGRALLNMSESGKGLIEHGFKMSGRILLALQNEFNEAISDNNHSSILISNDEFADIVSNQHQGFPNSVYDKLPLVTVNGINKVFELYNSIDKDRVKSNVHDILEDSSADSYVNIDRIVESQFGESRLYLGPTIPLFNKNQVIRNHDYT